MMSKVPAETTDGRPRPTPEPPAARAPRPPSGVPEIGGYKGPEPTRYGDWEHNGRCTDF